MNVHIVHAYQIRTDKKRKFSSICVFSFVCTFHESNKKAERKKTLTSECIWWTNERNLKREMVFTKWTKKEPSKRTKNKWTILFDINIQKIKNDNIHTYFDDICCSIHRIASREASVQCFYCVVCALSTATFCVWRCYFM